MPNIFKQKNNITVLTIIVFISICITSSIFLYKRVIAQRGNQSTYPAVLGAQSCAPDYIGGIVFNDQNSNGALDAKEARISNVVVSAYNAQNQKVSSATTDKNGSYFLRVGNKVNARIEFTQFPLGYYPGPNGKDSGGAVSFLTVNGNCNISLGLVKPGDSTIVELGDRIWLDSNKNGIQDASEPGISGVTLSLYEYGSHSPTQQTKTDSNGKFFFKSLKTNATYIIKINRKADFAAGGPLANHKLTKSNQGSNDSIDSDASINTESPEIPVAIGVCDLCNYNYDFGFYPAAVTGTPSPSPSSSPSPILTTTQRPTQTPTATQSPTPTLTPTTTVPTSTLVVSASPTPTGTVDPTPSNTIITQSSGTPTVPRELPRTGIQSSDTKTKAVAIGLIVSAIVLLLIIRERKNIRRKLTKK